MSLLALRWLGGGLALLVGLSACGFDWDKYDPRLGNGGTGASGLGGHGGTGATGGGGSGATGGGGSGATGGGGSGATGGGGSGATGGGGSGATGGSGGTGNTGGSGGTGNTGGSGGTGNTGGSGGTGNTGNTGGSGGTGNTGGTGGGPCGSVDVLGDDFNDGVPPYDWSADTSGTGSIDETGGQTLFTLPTDGNGGGAQAFTWRFYDLTGKRLRIQVPTMCNTAVDCVGWFGLGEDDNNNADFAQNLGVLYFEYVRGGVSFTAASIPYDPVAHRWWAFREQGGMFYWETSPDGNAWTVRASRLAPSQLFPVDSIQVGLGAYDYGSVSPGVVAFDNLQGGGPPTEGWCQASSFSDNFSAGALGHTWSARSWTSSSCSYTEQGGQLVFSHNGDSWESCGVDLPPAWDMTNDAIYVEVPALDANVANFNVWFGLEGGYGNWIEFDTDGNQLQYAYSVGGNTTVGYSQTYNAVQHRWWRIRESSGNTYWETSANGTNWVTRLMVPDPLPSMTALDVELGVDCGSGCATPAGVSFDNYNRLP
jgi:hypothetical protein